MKFQFHINTCAHGWYWGLTLHPNSTYHEITSVTYYKTRTACVKTIDRAKKDFAAAITKATLNNSDDETGQLFNLYAPK